MDQTVAIVMVPFPAQGHLNQLLHLSLILSKYDFSIHYAAPLTHINQVKSRLQGWPAPALDSVHFHHLNMTPFVSPPPNPDSAISFPTHLQPLFESFEQVRPHLASLLQSLSASCRRVVVIHDRISSFVGIEVSVFPNCESYSFQCVPPSTNLVWGGQDGPASDILKLHRLTVPSTDGCITEEFLALANRHGEGKLKDSGILMNASRLLEGEFINLLAQQPDCVGKKLFFIGPLNPTVIMETTVTRHECLVWLDKQPPSSVLYVSFGSCSSLSKNQIEQLAIGLLNSEQRFIWVLREADRADIFAEQNEVDVANKLPSGFLEQIEGKGIIIKDWAPQLDILSHISVASFMSHCGWNSCMESISMGVSILAWPMHSDQPWNAVLVSDYLKVGLIVKEWDKKEEIVNAGLIKEKIKKIMLSEEGKKIRMRAKDLGEILREDASAKPELLSFIDHIKR